MGLVTRATIAAALGVAVLCGAAAAGVEAEMELGINRMHGDYRDFLVPDNDPARCRQACDAESNCVAWTFVQPDGLRSGICFLKNQIPPQWQIDSCCISGIKKSAGGQ